MCSLPINVIPHFNSLSFTSKCSISLWNMFHRPLIRSSYFFIHCLLDMIFNTKNITSLIPRDLHMTDDLKLTPRTPLVYGNRVTISPPAARFPPLLLRPSARPHPIQSVEGRVEVAHGCRMEREEKRRQRGGNWNGNECEVNQLGCITHW